MRGCRKSIYHMKNTGSKYFTEAYLVIKSDSIRMTEYGKKELSEEADRIVKEALAEVGMSDKPSHCSTPVIGKAMSFALGAASSSALIGIVALIISFS